MRPTSPDNGIIDIRPKRKIPKKILVAIILLLLILVVGQSICILELQSDIQILQGTVAQEQSILQNKTETIDFFDQKVAFWSSADNHYHHYDCSELDQNAAFPIDVNYAHADNAIHTGLTPCPSCREEAQSDDYRRLIAERNEKRLRNN